MTAHAGSGTSTQPSTQPADVAGADLRALFAPEAIAIFGASGRADNPFARPLEYLLRHGYGGEVFPVNPRYETLHDVRCYPDLSSLPRPVDMVLLLVSAAEAVRQIPAVAAAGARVAIVFASGFGEIGTEGQLLQDEMVALARLHGVRLLGPNCQGAISVHEKMAATFTAAVEDSLPQPGGIAYVGQSGAVGGSILSLAGERGIGIADWASTGNQADLTALEIGEYLIGDDRVRVLTMYLESPVDGGQFERVARRARDLDKSVVVLQSGLSHSGARAAASHTGAIVGSNADFLAMAREFGVIVAEDIADFVTAMQSLTALPRARGRRVGIVTTSGGAGSLAADQLEAAGLLVEPLAETTQDRLRATVPAFGAVANPVDVTAQLFRSGLSDDFVNVCRTVVDDEEVDSLLVVLTMVTGEMAVTMAKDLRELWRTNSKPMVVVWLAAHAQTVEARALLSEEGWPVTDSPRLAARTLAVLSTDSVEERPRRAAVRTLAGVEERLAAVGGDIVTEAAATSLLELANVRQPRQAVATSARHAREVAVELGGTVVMKIQSAEVLHKTDRGGVRLSVPVDRAGEVFDELTAAFGEIPDAAVLVQEQIGEGTDLIVGMTRSGINFPPLLTVGVGGVATELYKDTTSFLAPVDAATARRMILALRAAPLMQGFRGMETLDLELVSEQIAAISQLGVALGDRLQELEINPLRVRAAGTDVVALDFLLRLSDAHATGEGGRSG